jgi:hypothetical protein
MSNHFILHLVALIDEESSPARIYGFSMIAATGFATLQLGHSIAQAKVPRNEESTVAGFTASGQVIGAVLLLTIGGAIYENLAIERVTQVAPPSLGAEKIIQLIAGAAAQEILSSLTPGQAKSVLHEIVKSIGSVFLTTLACGAILIIAGAFMRYVPLGLSTF